MFGNYYRLTLIRWENENTYSDTIYVDLCIRTPKFRTLNRAIKWLHRHENKLLGLFDAEERKECIAIDCDIEQWDKQDNITIVYSTEIYPCSIKLTR